MMMRGQRPQHIIITIQRPPGARFELNRVVESCCFFYHHHHRLLLCCYWTTHTGTGTDTDTDKDDEEPSEAMEINKQQTPNHTLMIAYLLLFDLHSCYLLDVRDPGPVRASGQFSSVSVTDWSALTNSLEPKVDRESRAVEKV